jgi:tRNA pseudouridine-54 N-methylase
MGSEKLLIMHEEGADAAAKNGSQNAVFVNGM